MLLALETATRRPSAALLRGDEILAQAEGAPGRSGAESVLPCIDAVLRRVGLALADVEAFAIGIGPGSFTGLRVGVATLKGLAFGSECPIAAVSTLAALARGAGAPGQAVVPLLDARRGELYAGVYRECDGDWLLEAPGEGVFEPAALAALLPLPCLLVGEGAALHGPRIRELAGGGVELGASGDPHARDVGALGLRLLARGEGVRADALLPRYLRRAQAEVKRTGERYE